MLVLPVGTYTPVSPVAPVAPVVARKAKTLDRPADRSAPSHPARSAAAMASHSTRAALDFIRLGG